MSDSVSADRRSVQRLPIHISIVKQRLEDLSVSGLARFVYGQLCDMAVRGEAGWYCERDLCRICPNLIGSMQHPLRELAAKGLIGRQCDRASRRIEYEIPRLPRSARGRFDEHYFAIYAAHETNAAYDRAPAAEALAGSMIAQ